MSDYCDDREAGQALRRMSDLWDPWYRITRGNGLWHAVRRDSGETLDAPGHEALQVKVILHYMKDRRIATIGTAEHMTVAQTALLAQIRAKHCQVWDYIGHDAESPGWRASRKIKPQVVQHIVTRTLDELDDELDELGGAPQLN